MHVHAYDLTGLQSPEDCEVSTRCDIDQIDTARACSLFVFARWTCDNTVSYIRLESLYNRVLGLAWVRDKSLRQCAFDSYCFFDTRDIPFVGMVRGVAKTFLKSAKAHAKQKAKAKATPVAKAEPASPPAKSPKHLD